MQLTKRLIVLKAYMLIALVVLTPQKVYCQYSDSTIREINERLIELHECRQKVSLYKVLADNDGKTIHRQDSIIQELIIANNQEKVAKTTYQTLSAFASALLVLALII